MPIRTLAGLSPPKRLDLETRMGDVTDAIKLEIAAAITRGDRIGASLTRLVRMPADTLRARARDHVEAVASRPAASALRDAAREFKAAPWRTVSAGETRARAKVQGTSLTVKASDRLAAKLWAKPGGAGEIDDAPKVSARYAILKLRRMKCIRRTRRTGEVEHGTDEISVMGVRFDASALEMAKIQPLDLGSWKDGQSRDYGTGGKKLFTVQFLRDQPLPMQAAALLTFAERDPDQGLLVFLEELWDAVKGLAMEEMSEWLDEKVSKPGEDPVPTDKDDIWIAILVQLIVEGITQLIRWLKSLTEDDIFVESMVVTASPYLVDFDEKWDTDNRTAVERFDVTQYGGEYAVDLFWELSDRR